MIRKFYGMEFGDFNGNMNEDIYTKKHDSKPPITHETFVIGFNENGDVIFLKSYEYLKQKDEAQSDLKWVIDNCHHWEIGAAREWKLMHQHLLHDIIIPHP